MRARLTRAALILALTLGASPAFAQTAAPDARGYVSVNAAYQATTNSFTTSWSLPYYLEPETLNASYSFKGGVLFDAGAGVRVAGALTLGVAVSRYHRSDFATLDASVPNPLQYNRPRSFDATAPGPSRTETAIHVSAMWVFALARRTELGVFGGPSFFRVNQATISAVNFTEVYPYDAVTIASTSTPSQTASKVGFNVGGDLIFLLRKQVGVGALVRYSTASVGFTGPDGAARSQKAGGLQVGGGLRLWF